MKNGSGPGASPRNQGIRAGQLHPYFAQGAEQWGDIPSGIGTPSLWPQVEAPPMAEAGASLPWLLTHAAARAQLPQGEVSMRVTTPALAPSSLSPCVLGRLFCNGHGGPQWPTPAGPF